MSPAARSWRDDAECLGQPEVMFPAPSDAPAVEDALALCAVCPVREMCREDALREEQHMGRDSRFGIRGGLDPRQRHGMQRRRRRAAARAAVAAESA